MSKVAIRPLDPAEAAALSQVARRSKAHWGYNDEQIAFWWDQLELAPAHLAGRPGFVAEQAGVMVGFYTLVRGDAAWELDNLWVVPERIGHGVGRTLFEHALATAARGGATEVTIDADPHAEAFYRHCGAVRRGEVPAPIPGLPDRTRPQLLADAARLRQALNGAEGHSE